MAKKPSWDTWFAPRLNIERDAVLQLKERGAGAGHSWTKQKEHPASLRTHAILGDGKVTRKFYEIRLKRKIRTSACRAYMFINKYIRGSLEDNTTYRVLDRSRPVFYEVIIKGKFVKPG